MEKIKSRQYNLPEVLSKAIEKELKNRFKLEITDSKKIASYIQKMSDYYIQYPTSNTPWKEEWCQVAQLCYFLPLNYLRAKAVTEEAKRIQFYDSFENAMDIGSGLGALTLHLQDSFTKSFCTEVSGIAVEIYRSLCVSMGVKPAQTEVLDISKKKNLQINNETLLTFSYSLTENISVQDLKHASGLMIIEPSTSQDGRILLELRQKLIDAGFYIWAPCTHQGKCPLYTQSKKDWCHDRIHVDMPDWFLNIENHLPFKNRTITYSYLLASKHPPISTVNAHKARTVGDTLHEKGKSKILICRGEEREFLSWLHRDLKDYEIPRGTIIDLPENLEKKGSELRWKK